MPAQGRYRRLAKIAAAAGRGRASVAGDGRDEGCDLFGFLALVEQGGHLPEATRAAFGDRAEDEFPCGPRPW